jgi:hypothetical protein
MPLIARILRPERFNAVELAIAAWDAEPSWIAIRGEWGEQSDELRQIAIDKYQRVLDKMVADGILGE